MNNPQMAHIDIAQKLMFITHPSPRYSIQEEVQMVLEGGCKWIQLRMKDAPDPDLAFEIKALCRAYGEDVVFCINDYPGLAFACNADALHLGKKDMPVDQAWSLAKAQPVNPGFKIGATTNSYDDIRQAVKNEASYVGLGPYRYTDTKQNLSPVLSIEGYFKILNQCKETNIQIPIFAIGGILVEDVAPLMATGITGIAVASAITRAKDPVKETGRFLYELNKK